MTEIPRSLHLLPNTATRLERALSASDARILDAPTGVIRTVLDPDRCPAHLLPYLAAHWGVDDWDERWPETIKRAVIRAAPEIHRTRGTPYAVETALSSLNIRAVLREFFEMVPQGAPHTFSVTAFVTQRLYDNSALITPDLVSAVRRAIIRGKRHSQWFTFAVGVATARPLALVARARVLGVSREAHHARPATDLSRPAALAARVRLLGAVAAATLAAPVTDLGRALALTARVRILGALTLSMEAHAL
jgi:phage tail P2-like protein